MRIFHHSWGRDDTWAADLMRQVTISVTQNDFEFLKWRADIKEGSRTSRLNSLKRLQLDEAATRAELGFTLFFLSAQRAHARIIPFWLKCHTLEPWPTTWRGVLKLSIRRKCEDIVHDDVNLLAFLYTSHRRVSKMHRCGFLWNCSPVYMPQCYAVLASGLHHVVSSTKDPAHTSRPTGRPTVP